MYPEWPPGTPEAVIEDLNWHSVGNSGSFWLTREALVQSMREAGFDAVYEQPDFVHDVTADQYREEHSRSLFVGLKIDDLPAHRRRASGRPSEVAALEMRSFVCVALAEEITGSDDLLDAYARQFGAGDDLTLLVFLDHAQRGETTMDEVAQLADKLGLNSSASPDVLVVAGEPGAEWRAGVASRAHAVLSRRPPAAWLADVPHLAEVASIKDHLKLAAGRQRH